MSSRIVLGIVIVVLLGSTGYFVSNYKVESQYENGKFAYMKIIPRNNVGGQPPAVPGTPGNDNPPPPQTNRSTFCIATYNLGGLDEAKLGNPRIDDVLLRLFPKFDLIAVQGLRGKNQGVPALLIEQLNKTSGRQYGFVTCPTQQRDGIEHYSGFFYDKAVLDVDRSTVRFVEDPQRHFRRKPLVGLFAARATPGPFTFYLVSVDTDPDKPAAELDLLADVFRSVRDIKREDGHNEDDVIMLGDFEADDRHLGRLAAVPGIAAAISDFPTTVRGAKLTDNILFDRRATLEFTGRAEVLDMMRELQLPTQAVADVSEHLPVWAEFSVYEGGARGFVPK